MPGPPLCSSIPSATDAGLGGGSPQEPREHVASPCPQQGAAPSPGFGQSCVDTPWKTCSFANPGLSQARGWLPLAGLPCLSIQQVCEELPGLGEPEKLAHACPERLPARRESHSGPRQGALQAEARLPGFRHPAPAPTPGLAKSKTEGQEAALHRAGLNGACSSWGRLLQASKKH